MSSSVNDIIEWSDNDFKKNINFDSFLTENRTVMQSKVFVRECACCGEKFAVYVEKGRPPKYCCEECSEIVRSQQSRNKSHKWYHNNKHKLTEKQRWGLGSGTLGQHRHKDFNKEKKTIKKELTRLKIKNR